VRSYCLHVCLTRVCLRCSFNGCEYFSSEGGSKALPLKYNMRPSNTVMDVIWDTDSRLRLTLHVCRLCILLYTAIHFYIIKRKLILKFLYSTNCIMSHLIKPTRSVSHNSNTPTFFLIFAKSDETNVFVGSCSILITKLWTVYFFNFQGDKKLLIKIIF
jgi:hypothetical protein